jgi:hypothetical protein
LIRCENGVEKNQNFVYGLEGLMQGTTGNEDGEVAFLPGITNQEAIEDQRRMKLSWKGQMFGWPRGVCLKMSDGSGMM